jgi:hypothetical protein
VELLTRDSAFPKLPARHIITHIQPNVQRHPLINMSVQIPVACRKAKCGPSACVWQQTTIPRAYDLKLAVVIVVMISPLFMMAADGALNPNGDKILTFTRFSSRLAANLNQLLFCLSYAERKGYDRVVFPRIGASIEQVRSI